VTDLAEIEEALRAAPPAAVDPLVRSCTHDPRPVDYARAFALAARRLLLLEDGDRHPPWWSAARESPSATVLGPDRGAAFTRLADADRTTLPDA
jgi:hypothetical protein